MSTVALYRRIIRRELHSPRSALAIIVSIVVMLMCLYVGTEIVLMMLGHGALLIAPQEMLTVLSALGSAPMQMSIIVGIVLLLFGLLLVIAAVAPGRRARHELRASRAAVTVDDEVIASALARHAAHAGNAHPDNTVVSVSARRATVRLTPTSGIPVRRDEVSEAVEQQLEAFDLTPSLRSAVVVAATGKVGT